MRSYPARWWVAGGWSLNLFIGHPTRLHEDTDALVLYRDLHPIHTALPGWTIYASDPPETLRPWVKGDRLPKTIRDIWCRPTDAETWWFQFMIMHTEGDHRIFPRDRRVTGAVADLSDARDGIPIIAPELQLLYKSRVPHRARDTSDMRRMIPRLITARQQWLRERVELLYPDSPALELLRNTDLLSS